MKAARINALVWIGKHIGMWQEKQEQEKDTKPTINIVQYGVSQKEAEKELNRPEVVNKKDDVTLPEGVIITSYEDSDAKH